MKNLTVLFRSRVSTCNHHMDSSLHDMVRLPNSQIVGWFESSWWPFRWFLCIVSKCRLAALLLSKARVPSLLTISLPPTIRYGGSWFWHGWHIYIMDQTCSELCTIFGAAFYSLLHSDIMQQGKGLEKSFLWRFRGGVSWLCILSLVVDLHMQGSLKTVRV